MQSLFTDKRQFFSSLSTDIFTVSLSKPEVFFRSENVVSFTEQIIL